ncbi:MAG: ribonuclease H-like YkuK family protein [Patescibacteria group bacterium]|nr:ribonuclease H-like YkuK family protein [Patescibacteria group bacterium]
MLYRHIKSFLSVDHTERYSLIIGTDSQARNGHGVDFVTAIIVHRKGKGGVYFWKRVVRDKKYVLRQRMYEEAMLSLETAETILKLFEKDGITKYNMEIHVDIGSVGQTKEMIGEIVGMIRGSGYRVKIKPDSYGASKVADRYT